MDAEQEQKGELYDAVRVSAQVIRRMGGHWKELFSAECCAIVEEGVQEQILRDS